MGKILYFFLFTGILCSKSRLIWISIDAFKSDIFDSGKYKFLEESSKNGVHVKKLHPMFVSKTFPNHLSEATGLNVEEHGVIANAIEDKELGSINHSTLDRRWWDPENQTMPIWTIVEKSGGKAGVIYWPGSGVNFGGIYPSFYHPIYNSSCDVHCRIDKAVNLFKNGSYDLIMVYIADYDSQCHKDGPDAISTRYVMSEVNNAIESLIDQIKNTIEFNSTSIMISGDHGMASISDERAILASELIGNLTEVKMVQDGPVGMFNCKIPQCDELIERAKHFRHIIFAGYKKDLPEELHYSNNSRIPDVLILMEEGWMIKYINTSYGNGNHGYAWQYASSMNSKFIGFNHKFKSGVEIEEMEVTDLFIIACNILNLKNKCHNKRKLPENVLKPALSDQILPAVLIPVIVLVLLVILWIYMHKKKI